MVDESASSSVTAGRPDHTHRAWWVSVGLGLAGGALLVVAWQRAVAHLLDGWLVASLTLGLGLAVAGIIRWPAGRRWLQQAWGAEALAPEARTFVLVGGQLGLLALVVQRLQLETVALYQTVIPLAYGGFVFHHLLPHAYRRPAFVLLSWVGCLLVLGLAGGLWFIALALLLIGICHIPLPYPYRVGILLLLGGGLAWLRLGAIHTPWTATLWPIWPALAVLGMFRLGIYLVEQRRQPAGSWWQTLAYFFMLPGLVFPLFPVIDYATLRRTYYDRPAGEIYQTGLQWMVRGVGQLILYRFLDHYLYLAPDAVQTPRQLLQFILVNYALYVRISGQFHLIIGMLHLFGFNLPLANQHYFLAHNFNDFWRRINIYWKEFMLRYFFYPATMRLRGWRMELRLIVALLYVLGVTWFLHTYQWFWIRGEVRLIAQDGIFWGVFGLFMIANALYEARAAGRRPVKTPLAAHGWRALGIVGTFTLIALIWSFWTAPSVEAWQQLWQVVRAPELLVLLGGGLGLSLRPAGTAASTPGPGIRWRWSPAWFTALVIVVLFLLTSPVVQPRLGDGWQTPLHVLQTPPAGYTPARGYYEALLQPLPPYAATPPNLLPLETQP